MFNNSNCKKIINTAIAVALTFNAFNLASKCQSIPDAQAIELAKLAHERAQAVWDQAEKEAKEKGITLTCKNCREVETIMGQYCPFNRFNSWCIFISMYSWYSLVFVKQKEN